MDSEDSDVEDSGSSLSTSESESGMKSYLLYTIMWNKP